MSPPTSSDVVRLLLCYLQEGVEPLSPEESVAAARLSAAIRERFGAVTLPGYQVALDEFERHPTRWQASFGRLLDDLIRRDPAFAARLRHILATAADEHSPDPPYPSLPVTVRRAGTVVISPGAATDGPAPLPLILADLCDRLMVAFNLEEMKDLALNLGFIPDTIPNTTLQAHTRGLILACWRGAKLDRLAAEAARLRPQADWSVSFAGLPATPPPEFDHDDMPFVRQTILAETVKVIRSIFSDTQQVLAFLGVVLGVAALSVAAIFLSRQPRCELGDFTIAVAEFDQLPPDGRPLIGQSLSRTLAGLLSHEMEDGPLAGVSVCHVNMPEVTTMQEVKALAQRLRADLLIYGETTIINDRAVVGPRFYVNNPRFEVDLDELNGDHALAAPLSFSLEELIGDAPPSEAISNRAALLTDFTRALVLMAYGDLPEARRAIDSAAVRAEAFGNLPGVEVVFLFASHIARVEGDLSAAESYAGRTLAANPAYGRGHIALGNILFDQGNYYRALEAYTLAAGLPDQPPEALVSEKAALGAGNVYLAQLLSAPGGQPDCAEDYGALARGGWDYFQYVIDTFHTRKAADEPDDRLSGLAALAYAYTGRIHHACGDKTAAAVAYCAALGLPLPAQQQKETEELLARLSTAEEGIEQCGF